jgi:2-polyprenyl-6-methoxyphenol hydroxylase-like FAD-dependent oxidoreductase
VETALLIGADGRTSRVRRLAGLDAPSPRRRQALACRAESWDMDAIAEMRFGPLGQVGVAPLGGGTVNLNLLLSEAAAAAMPRRRPAELMRAALAADGALAAHARRARLGPVLASGPLTHGARARAGAAVALVGDAAGCFDPVTGDGITLALLGAERLAGALGTLPWKPPFGADALAAYRDAPHGGAAAHPLRAAALHHLLARRGLAAGLVALTARLDPRGRVLEWLCG